MALLLLAGCIPKADVGPELKPPPQVDAAAAPDPDKATRQCLAELRHNGVQFRPLTDRYFEDGCSALGSVQLLEIGTPVSNLGAMTCPLARQLARWTREAVQPAARQWLGTKVVKIESMGSYACRPVNSRAGAKLSEHGSANAVDVGAFLLEDGRRVTVLSGWNGPDEDVRNFLRAVHRGGCSRFQTGLGPDANAAHRDHMHFDMGRGPYCR